MWIVAILALSLLLGAVPRVAAEVIDGNVARFEAVPSYINLNRTTKVEVEIDASYGAGLDNYLVTVVTPGGGTSTSWYNFTAVEAMNLTFGDPASGFAQRADEVGTYTLRLEYFNGTAYRLDGIAQLQVTDQLDVVFLIRSASNPATDVHSCPVASEFVRGAKFIGGAYVYYASTGEEVTGTNSNAAGNITGAILGETRVLVGPPLWHSAWYFPWDAPVGEVKFYVNASDGRGNVGSAVTGQGTNSRLTIVPDTLVVSARILNATGADSVNFAPGDTIRIVADVRYDDHAARNTAYEGPLNATRGGSVAVHLGWGAFNATSGRFANLLADVTLSLDVPTQTWIGTYAIPAGTANLTAVQGVVTAADGASPANTGAAFTTQFAIRTPAAPEILEVPVPGPSTGFEMTTVSVIAVALLAAGMAVGFVVSRMRRKNGGAAKPKAEKPEESSDDPFEES